MLKLKRKRLVFDTAVLTDTGMVRDNNEDNYFVLDIDESEASGDDSYGIYLVADGMGGHQAGEVASQVASQTISSTLLDSLRGTRKLQSPSHLVKQAIQKANAEIYKMAHSDTRLSTMGTTATLGLRLDNMLYLGHIGDSRAYLIRKGRIKQLTEDHSLVARLLKEGVITPEEAKTHPDRGKILRCLGTSAQVTVDNYKKTLHSDDSLVFCTDGLTNHVADSEILDYVEKGSDANSVCQDLINLANKRGGVDNISVIVVRVNVTR